MTDEQRAARPLALDGLITTSKGLISLLRDLSLLVLAVLLIVFPKALNSVLVDAGFEEGSLVGFKWKANLVHADDALKEAQKNITQLQSQNEELTKALAEANEKLGDSSIKERLSRLKELNRQVRITSEQVQSAVAQTIAANAPLVEKARSATGALATPPAGFCYQEDRLNDGPDRYSVHCHSSQESCEKARGPNARWKQSACEFVDLTRAAWNPKSGGWLGAWYEFRGEPFAKPFPQLQ